jgi:hypothetical protein
VLRRRPARKRVGLEEADVSVKDTYDHGVVDAAIDYHKNLV